MTLTDDAAQSWQEMGLTRQLQLQRMIEWANMLELRVAELDPNYRAYQFGRATSQTNAT